MRLSARHTPLSRGLPLHVLIEENFTQQLPPRTIDVRRFAALQRRGPFGPGAFVLVRVNRPEQGIVLDPPCLLADISLQLTRDLCRDTTRRR